MLLSEFLRLVAAWRPAFAQHRTFVRVLAVLLGLVCTPRRRTLTSALVFRGRTRSGWSADYLAFSRAPWDVQALFGSVTQAAVDVADVYAPGAPFVLVLDDTSVKKWGHSIPGTHWMRDPLSPPFRTNLRFGLRYLHFGLVLPLHRQGFDPRVVSVDFHLAPAPRKPGRRATEDERKAFRELQKTQNLSCQALARLQAHRARLDSLGHPDRPLLLVVDGSYTNRTLLKALPPRVELLGRTRKDVALVRPASPGGRKVYGDRLPTPEALRRDPAYPERTAELHYGGERRHFRYQEIGPVLWPGGAQRRRLRLLILAPTRYRAPRGAGRRWAYRQPAYLLTTDLVTPAAELIQAYLDRWQIEPLHRDLKDGVGVGEAQVWAPKSVARLHTAAVATWSMVTLAALKAFGPCRTDAFEPLPAWRSEPPNHRASQRDLTARLLADLQALTTQALTTSPLRATPPPRLPPPPSTPVSSARK